MRKINTFIAIGIVIIIIVGGWIILSDKIEQSFSWEENRISQGNIEKETTLLIIDDSESAPEIFEVEFQEGTTPFDLLRNKTEELNMILKTKNHDFGIFIEAIGGKENGEDGKNWMYYVNGELPMVAADKKQIKPGDRIEIKFEESPF